ncbi:hypothetical protein KM043_009352 [Ampulex compressa]|nr:hypothetical protein KM043_009352 [Ampulex compressa]
MSARFSSGKRDSPRNNSKESRLRTKDIRLLASFRIAIEVLTPQGGGLGGGGTLKAIYLHLRAVSREIKARPHVRGVVEALNRRRIVPPLLLARISAPGRLLEDLDRRQSRSPRG